MIERYFNYGEAMSCNTEEELAAFFQKVAMGFSGKPEASVMFLHYINQKEGIDWIIARANQLRLFGGETLNKATDYRRCLVMWLKELLE